MLGDLKWHLNKHLAQRQWLMPVILTTQEAQIRRITVWSQPGQIVLKTLCLKKSSQKRAGGVLQHRPWVQTPVSQKRKKNLFKVKEKWQKKKKSFHISVHCPTPPPHTPAFSVLGIKVRALHSKQVLYYLHYTIPTAILKNCKLCFRV
jgi:hypothetical protein